MDHHWLCVDEIAEYLGVAKHTIYTRLSSKAWPGYQVGRFWKTKKAGIAAWVRGGGACFDSNANQLEPGL